MFVPSTFLTVTGLSSFCSLNLYFATIFLCMNISVALLSRSTFIVMPLYISTFSIPIFNYTSLNILNILLIFLCLSSSFSVLFGASFLVPLCCTSPFLEYAATLQSHYSYFFPVPYSGHKIFFLSFSGIFLTISFLPHWLYFTTTTLLSPAVSSLHFYALRQLLYHTFLNCSPETNPCLWFLYILVPL